MVAKKTTATKTKPVTDPKALKAEKPVWKTPKSLGACADLLYSTQQQRYAAQKEVDKLEGLEKALKDRFINELSTQDASGIAGKQALAKIVVKDVPTMDDDKAFYAHVKKTGDFDLLQRRLSAEAVKLRWQAGKKVPGVGVFHSKSVSITKL